MEWLSFIKNPIKGENNIETTDMSKADLMCFDVTKYSEEKAKFIAKFHEFKGNVHLSKNENFYNVWKEQLPQKEKTKPSDELVKALASAGL